MSRYPTVILASLIVVILGVVGQASAASSVADVISAAIADPGRPAADRKQDVNRKPLKVLEFAGVKPGDRVADFIPGRGYVTRLFSKIVGKRGHVYAIVPKELFSMNAKADAAVKAIAADKEYSNVTVITEPAQRFAVPEKLDMVWTSMNYHDLHDKFLGPVDMAVLNKRIFNALKPGGIYLVLDHAAAAGSGLRDTETLHRIDPAAVKKEVLAAGFVLEASSDVLHNPKDDHTRKVFDPAIRGRTDKFIFRFRKPK
ncbi:MAG: methyltransferase [Gammaproteobacteria bacterium]|jgi:predicted methyltransferase